MRGRPARRPREHGRRDPHRVLRRHRLALVAGFGGLRDSDGELRFSPRLPGAWDGLRFRVAIRGQLVEVDMTRSETTYRLIEGHGIQLHHFGEQVRLKRGIGVVRPLEQEAPELPRAA